METLFIKKNIYNKRSGKAGIPNNKTDKQYPKNKQTWLDTKKQELEQTN